MCVSEGCKATDIDSQPMSIPALGNNLLQKQSFHSFVKCLKFCIHHPDAISFNYRTDRFGLFSHVFDPSSLQISLKFKRVADNRCATNSNFKVLDEL